MVIRTLAAVMLLAVAACSSEPRVPSAEETAFVEAITPYCGTKRRDTATCQAFLVADDGEIALISAYSGSYDVSALLTYHGSRREVSSQWTPVSWFARFEMTPYQIVGPGDENYEEVRGRFLGIHS